MAAWQTFPFKIELKAGETKAFCMCGLSKNGPFCDGSHQVTETRPKIIQSDKDQTLYICGCQQSGKRPFCDATHKTLDKTETG